MDGVERAREAAETALAEALPRRWRHVRGVAARARTVSARLPAHESEVLVAAAWLHDIGYGPAIRDSGFHPLDGARHVRAAGFGERLAALVAHHSAAAAKAEVLGMTSLLAEFVDEQTPTRDLLWYSDMTAGPDGEPVTFTERMAEIRMRRAGQPAAIAALELSLPARRTAVERAELFLDAPLRQETVQNRRGRRSVATGRPIVGVEMPDEFAALRAAAAGGDHDAEDQLVELAGERGDLAELRRLADAGSSDAVAILVELAGEREDLAELRRLAAAGSTDARDVLLELSDDEGSAP